jgi:hypothetical protein
MLPQITDNKQCSILMEFMVMLFRFDGSAAKKQQDEEELYR